MKEQKPAKNSDNVVEEINSDRIQNGMSNMRKRLRTHRLSRVITNSILRYFFFTTMFLDPKGREALKNSEYKDIFFNRERRTGLLEESILNPSIYHPNKEVTSLELSSSPAGRWSAYDFNRASEFNLGNRTYERSKKIGRLAIFQLDEIKTNNADTYTPTALFNLFNALHILTISFPTIDEALEEGFLQETTYKKAYSNVNLYDKYKLYLFGAGIIDHPLYTVTPKGNSVVFLLNDGGDKVEKPKAVTELKPVFEPSV